MMKKKLSSLLLVAILFMTVSCDEPVQKRGSKNYETLTASRSNSNIASEYTASIRGTQSVDIRPQISGIITKISINEGAKVKKGQTLFIIDQVPYIAALEIAKANVKSAEANVATAKLNAESSNELFKGNIISDNERQVAFNNLSSAEANLALTKAQEVNASNNLSYTVVKSPVDGVTGMITYREGALVSPSITEPLVSVTNNENMYAYFSMSESQILALVRENGSTEKLLKNMPEVELVLNDGVTYQHKGKVDAISGVIDENTGTVALRAIFSNPEQMLRDGGNGRIVIETEYENVIVIPHIATFEIQNKVFVYKVIDGKATSSQISVVTPDNGKEYIIKSGIEDGEVIIAAGAGLIREGTPVGSAKKQQKPQQSTK